MATVQAQMKAEIIKHSYSHLPASACDTDEINKKAGALFAHIYSSGGGVQGYHWEKFLSLGGLN